MTIGLSPPQPEDFIRRFAANTHGVRHTLLLGVDGLAICWSEDLDQDLADRTAAVASSLMSLADAGGGVYACGPAEIAQVRYSTLYFLTVSVGQLGVLAVVVNREPGVNLAVIGNEMARLVATLGDHLAPDARGLAGSIASAMTR